MPVLLHLRLLKRYLDILIFGFKTTCDLPTTRHIAFIVTDCNNQSYIIGQHEKPRPIVKVTRNTGTPDGDPAVRSVEVTLYAQRSLIPCEV